MTIRNRIKELRMVSAGDLKADPRNWRTHPSSQRKAIQTMLDQVGYADALIAREDENGTLHLIDGHLRADVSTNEQVPVLVLDVSVEEAGMLLATIDPLSRMAETDDEGLRELINDLSLGAERDMKNLLHEIESLYDVDIPEPREPGLGSEDVPEPEYVVLTFRLAVGEYELKKDKIEEAVRLLGVTPSVEQVN